MVARFAVVGVVLALASLLESADACCPVSRFQVPVVNADQSVIILWDAEAKTQHFIRRASFKSDGDDFGFLIPSPAQPELSESGNEAFPLLAKLTEPETITRPRPISFGCGVATMRDAAPGLAWSGGVKVLEQKTVAGFNASVLEAKSATALVQWLKENGYHYSREVEAWAKPYVDQGWKITALKVAKDKETLDKTVNAAALRLSFKTDRPLFPYREPEYKGVNDTLGIKSRTLRIYFLADARYEGELTKEQPWSGKVVWSGKVTAKDRSKLLEHLKLPELTGPRQWWLTEFEDDWSYQGAPADVYFSRAAKQATLKRPPIVQYVSNTRGGAWSLALMAAAACVPSLASRWRRA